MSEPTPRLSTGLEELDAILSGGLVPGASYLVRGDPGGGKTTLGLHFLAAAGAHESGLFIGFQEPTDQITANAAAVGIDVSNVEFLNLAPEETFFTGAEGYDLFPSADVEGEPLTEAIVAAIDDARPSRVVIDSMTHLRILAADAFQYRKQVLAFLRYLRERGATVLFTSERSVEHPDDDLQFLADGVLTLENGGGAARLRVSKFRGSGFQRGDHQTRLGPDGLRVFPRPVPPRHERGGEAPRRLGSGVERLDRILNGGLEEGTITLVSGPSGVGKSTFASLFVAHAATEGRRAAMYVFEEEATSLLARTEALGIPLGERHAAGDVVLEQVEPMRYLADEFAWLVRRRIEEEGLDLVVLDSTAGYGLTLEGAQEAKTSLHAFAKSLARAGVSVVLVNETEAVTGAFRISEKGISYLADNVIVLRYIEHEGALRKVLGVLKKRLSPFDPRLHPFDLRPPEGFDLGAPLQALHGTLTGVPEPVATD